MTDQPHYLAPTDEAELLPLANDEVAPILTTDFHVVSESDTDKITTQADLHLLNNMLGLCHAATFKVATIAGLCALSTTVCKLVETRRKVKKLAFGEPGKSGGKGGFTCVE